MLSAMLMLLCLVLFSGCANLSANVISTPVISSVPTSPPIASTISSPTSLPYITPPTGLASSTPQSTFTQPPSAVPSLANPTETPQATSTQPAPTQSVQVSARYNLDVVFDYWKQSLSVAETVQYLNLSADTISDLTLVVEPNLVPGSFKLRSITWEDGQLIDTFGLNHNQMHILLPSALESGAALSLKIAYDLYIPKLGVAYTYNGPVAYGYSARQTNIVDWYPYIPPYVEGQGWLVHQPWWLGEYQVFDVADFDVTIRLATPVKDLVLAASAPATQDGDQYSFHLEAARSFAISASTEYLVQTITAGNVTVIGYSFPYDKYSGQEALKDTADAVQLFSRLILPYPRATLSVVEADFLDGMEYDGLFFLSYGFYDLYDGTPKGYLTFIAAHETAHQWWYGLVGNDQALQPWLDESLCTYMENIFYGQLYSDYPPRSGGSLVDWWWYYRVGFYDPGGLIGGSIYDFQDFRSYRNAIYLNGAKFLDDLRKLIGDEAFFASLREYALKNYDRIATSQDFFTALKVHTDQNLDGLIATYFGSSP
jgi:hypothetical protein